MAIKNTIVRMFCSRLQHKICIKHFNKVLLDLGLSSNYDTKMNLIILQVMDVIGNTL